MCFIGHLRCFESDFNGGLPCSITSHGWRYGTIVLVKSDALSLEQCAVYLTCTKLVSHIQMTSSSFSGLF